MYASMALIGALKDSGLINEQIGYQAQLLRNASDLNGTAARKRSGKIQIAKNRFAIRDVDIDFYDS